jgi:hypothetical protein
VGGMAESGKTDEAPKDGRGIGVENFLLVHGSMEHRVISPRVGCS